MRPPPKRNITQLKRDVSISDVLTKVGNMRTEAKWGRGWQAIRCPFHDDAHASAAVNDQEGRFWCHACDVGGSIIDVALHHLDTTDIREAIEWLEANFK